MPSDLTACELEDIAEIANSIAADYDGWCNPETRSRHAISDVETMMSAYRKVLAELLAVRKLYEFATAEAEVIRLTRERDEALMLNEFGPKTLRELANEYGRMVMREAVASPVPSCEMMTGEQLYDFIFGERGEWDDERAYWHNRWNALAAHIWPSPPPAPDVREQLRVEIERTDHGEFLTVLELRGRVACTEVDGESWYWFVSGVLDNNKGAAPSCDTKAEAIAAAENWLLDQAVADNAKESNNAE